MDTTLLEAKIADLQTEIATKQANIDLLKDGITMAKKALKIYQDGLAKIKEKEK